MAGLHPYRDRLSLGAGVEAPAREDRDLAAGPQGVEGTGDNRCVFAGSARF
jgi:hypothetical protein